MALLFRTLNSCSARNLPLLCRSHSVHIPPYKEPDKYHLNNTDLNLIITKSRFLTFVDDSSSSQPQAQAQLDEAGPGPVCENGSFVLQLSTELAHATYLVSPIWRRYAKLFRPTMLDVECMLSYLNINEGWAKGRLFIERVLLLPHSSQPLSHKSWRHIAEIALKATSHRDCVHLVDAAVQHCHRTPKVVAWREIVKVLLIKRHFDKVVLYTRPSPSRELGTRKRTRHFGFVNWFHVLLVLGDFANFMCAWHCSPRRHFRTTCILPFLMVNEDSFADSFQSITSAFTTGFVFISTTENYGTALTLPKIELH